MKICGIDPGSNGAICVLDTGNSSYVALLDLKKHSIYDATQWLHSQKPDNVWVEDVHSLFGMSAKSNFGFGRNLGFALAIAETATAGQTPRMVTPKVWQKYAGVTVRGKIIKKEVHDIAQKLFPTAVLQGARGGLLDGRSDALMICYYGMNHI